MKKQLPKCPLPKKLLLEPLVHICIKMNGESEVIQNSLPPLFHYLAKIFLRFDLSNACAWLSTLAASQFWKVQGSHKPLIYWKWEKMLFTGWHCGHDKCSLFRMVLRRGKARLLLAPPDALQFCFTPSMLCGEQHCFVCGKGLIKFIVCAEVDSFSMMAEQQSQLQPYSLSYLNQDQFMA